jgi:UDP-N-acetylglucosamine 2-epimerase (non-hydrolysing)
MPVIFPAHPRTLANLERLGLQTLAEDSGVHVCEPLGYLDFLGLEAEAKAVLTDSGGVQEEASVLQVPCFTLRNTTERPVTVELGTNTVIGLSPERIAEVPTLLARKRDPSAIPLWDGRAGVRAAEVLAAFLDS